MVPASFMPIPEPQFQQEMWRGQVTWTYWMNFVTRMLKLERLNQASPKEKLALPLFIIYVKMQKYPGIGYQREISDLVILFSNADDWVTTSTSENCFFAGKIQVKPKQTKYMGFVLKEANIGTMQIIIILVYMHSSSREQPNNRTILILIRLRIGLIHRRLRV